MPEQQTAKSRPTRLQAIEPTTRARARAVRRAKVFRLVATEAITAGEVILYLEGVLLKEPTRFSVQVGWEQHVDAAPGADPIESVKSMPWRFLNHSCAPTAFLRGRLLIAKVDLRAGEEVTFDYHTTEWDMASPFACECGVENCVGIVRGYRHLDPARRRLLRPWLAEHLIRQEAEVKGGRIRSMAAAKPARREKRRRYS